MTASPELRNFIRESNAIEGIHRDPTADELHAAERLMLKKMITAAALGDFQAVVAPGLPLREREGMNVRVGDYVAPPGGPDIPKALQRVVRRANAGDDPWEVHLLFEALHPYLDGNGRTGRILWAWQMHNQGKRPFDLGFLHRWYYETLAHLTRAPK